MLYSCRILQGLVYLYWRYICITVIQVRANRKTLGHIILIYQFMNNAFLSATFITCLPQHLLSNYVLLLLEEETQFKAFHQVSNLMEGDLQLGYLAHMQFEQNCVEEDDYAHGIYSMRWSKHISATLQSALLIRFWQHWAQLKTLTPRVIC